MKLKLVMNILKMAMYKRGYLKDLLIPTDRGIYSIVQLKNRVIT